VTIATEKIHTCECSKKTTGNNVEFVLGLLLYSNGKGIRVFIKEPVFAVLVVKIKIFVKSALSTYNLDFQWK
jgi:hypothetical protein